MRKAIKESERRNNENGEEKFVAGKDRNNWRRELILLEKNRKTILFIYYD